MARVEISHVCAESERLSAEVGSLRAEAERLREALGLIRHATEATFKTTDDMLAALDRVHDTAHDALSRERYPNLHKAIDEGRIDGSGLPDSAKRELRPCDD